ncbi:hypothetical protein, partial [Klebsiella pneumoniae]|uniref:hypothetical protein n=1 Tax=Klebsiella pneumoniae TaxID=573 RepID=UPI0024DED66A
MKRLLYDIILAKFHFSWFKCLFFTGVLSDTKLAVEPGYESATIRNTLLEFQHREIHIQTTQN